MNFIIGLILLFLLLSAIKQFARMDAGRRRRGSCATAAASLGMIGALLLLAARPDRACGGARRHGRELRRLADARAGRRRRVPRVGGRARRPGRVSTARSAMIEMRLDHDSGAMSGAVLAGAYAGPRARNAGAARSS